MPERTAFAAGTLLRPLLPVTRAALEGYVRAAGLGWVEDDSNAELRFDRNFLRQRITPLLRERWPSAAATVSRSAGLLAEAQSLLDESAEAQWRQAADGDTLRVSALRALRPSARANLVRWWLRQRGLPVPEQSRLRELCGPLLAARGDAQPQMRWDGVELHRHDGRLHAFAPLLPLPVGPMRWDWRRTPQLRVAGAGILELQRDPHGGLDLSRLPRTLEVRFRSGGERLRGSAEGRALKEWLRAQRLPPWERARLPLIHADGRLIAVADRWLAPQDDPPRTGRLRGRFRWRWQLETAPD
jgi:tRNA(Ile)-lysidine synthase